MSCVVFPMTQDLADTSQHNHYYGTSTSTCTSTWYKNAWYCTVPLATGTLVQFRTLVVMLPVATTVATVDCRTATTSTEQ